ncbi:hypothetical protein BCIN_12g05985 [Botrytis cinerea B05.10]|uniref:LYC1 C-terminal domain-containing protein n=1 Tax=Botryotinia fuckeliana (strain B05.10) TaxID=332648 RepID=A0A384JZR9_BOTFB|nr:hypothetical protein BCIN_12g05985 [Botrytis cinerea B05.10]ATZ56063.1 hypothetical protein BCIN_12g05985 [Botrytis cinerea B05.10]
MFPDYNSPDLHLAHPTPEEKLATWNLNYEEWGKALSKSDYLHREQYLASVPLTSDDGITYWCLVDRSSPPNNREIYASCESLRKKAFISKEGKVEEVIIHSIGSVFCPPKNRGRKYASRMMTDLGNILKTWQLDPNIPGRHSSPASILFSDIGKKFYANHGWHPFPSSHISLPPLPTPTESTPSSILPTLLKEEDLPALCALDTTYIRRVLERAIDHKTHIALLPDHPTIQWHHLRENVMSTSIFGRAPEIKGAMAGDPGARIWAYWTRGYYGPIDSPKSGNCLHILRLVLEDETNSVENAAKLDAVLREAQREAREWKMTEVQFWNPTSLVEDLLERGAVAGKGKVHLRKVEREEESVASLMWYGEGEGTVDELEWWGNEKYGWC